MENTTNKRGDNIKNPGGGGLRKRPFFSGAGITGGSYPPPLANAGSFSPGLSLVESLRECTTHLRPAHIDLALADVDLLRGAHDQGRPASQVDQGTQRAQI